MNTVLLQRQLSKMDLPRNTKEGLLNVIDMKVEDEKDKLVTMMNHMEDRLTLRMDSMEAQMNARMDSMETQMNARMDNMEAQMNARMDKMDVRIDGVELRIDHLDTSLNKRMDTICWCMGIGFTILSVLITLVGLAVVNR